MTSSTPAPADKRERLEAATYTVAELATLLGCSERHVHRQRDRKAIPGEIRCGKCVRFARRVIDGWLSGGAVPSAR